MNFKYRKKQDWLRQSSAQKAAFRRPFWALSMSCLCVPPKNNVVTNKFSPRNTWSRKKKLFQKSLVSYWVWFQGKTKSNFGPSLDQAEQYADIHSCYLRPQILSLKSSRSVQNHSVVPQSAVKHSSSQKSSSDKPANTTATYTSSDSTTTGWKINKLI